MVSSGQETCGAPPFHPPSLFLTAQEHEFPMPAQMTPEPSVGILPYSVRMEDGKGIH